MNNRSNHPAELDDVTLQTLAAIARRCGTPTYAFDLRRARAQVEKLRRHLPAAVEILYSLKANASLGICDVFAACGLGADVASAGELATAVEAGFPPERIFVAGPFKLPETVAQLRELPDAVVSVDSPSELEALIDQGVRNRLVLRLRPDFGSSAVVTAGRESRFGFTAEDLPRCRDLLARRVAGSLREPSADGTRRVPATINVIGFHVFAGSQVLKADGVIEHLRGGFRLCTRAADALGITPTLLNLGGGFGIPYGPDDNELDLVPIADELATLVDRARPARLALELGRYLIAQAGWYLTSLLGHQTHQCRPAVVVDGGTHQRADLCGLCLRSKAGPVALDGSLDRTAARSASEARHTPTDVLGCLSLPADVLAESTLLPPLEPGDVLAFPNAGAYGVWSSPALFHGSPLPAEVAFDGSTIHVMRERQRARSILHGQQHVTLTGSRREPSAAASPALSSSSEDQTRTVPATL